MKCHETDRLKEYAYGLMNEANTAELRAHLDECSRCREVVQQHHRLGAVLDEWKVGEPTPGFDARVRMAVDQHQAQSQGWKFWSWEWMRGVALASLGVLIVAGVAWFTQNHRGGAHPTPVGVIASRPDGGERVPAKVVTPQLPVQSAQARVAPVRPGLTPESAPLLSNDDGVARAMEDYDLAANFDVLSEIPKAEGRVAD
jgi:hypothetical protein